MEIKVKNFRILVSNSDETWCYTADIWVDGVPALSVRNDGRGSPDEIHAHPKWKGNPSDVYEQVLWPINEMLHEQDPQHFTNSLGVSNFEVWMGDYIEDHLKRKELRRLLNKSVVTIEDDGIYTYKFKYKSGMELLNHFEGKQVLNAMLFEDALKAFKSVG